MLKQIRIFFFFTVPCLVIKDAPSSAQLMISRMLESLAGCFTKSCASDFFSIFYYFGSLWYSSCVIDFPLFFIRAKITKLHLPRLALNSNQIQLCKLPLCVHNFQIDLKMNQAVNQLAFVVVKEWKLHFKKHSFGIAQIVRRLVRENSVFEIEIFLSL